MWSEKEKIKNKNHKINKLKKYFELWKILSLKSND